MMESRSGFQKKVKELVPKAKDKHLCRSQILRFLAELYLLL